MNHPFTTVAHIGVAVPSVSEAVAFYRDVLRATPSSPETADGATIVSLPFAEVDIELLEPDRPGSPIAKFIEKRGAGIHHICFRVPDLDEALDRCRSEGYTLIDETPRPGAHGCRIAFIHPKTTNGILIELTE